MALMTIHRMGKKPNAAPSVAASSAWPAGIEYTAIATTSATPSEMSPASHARMRSTPSRTKRVSSGSTAKMAEAPMECATGSVMILYWSNMGSPEHS
jgi:hypothetical protein